MELKHPKALVPLFLTELWERFGFYINEGLLVLFLAGYFLYSDQKSYSILGEFSALVYISPVFGGFIADRILGFRYSILLGAILLFSGYAIISLCTFYHPALFWGLATIVVGNGFLKPNISAFLGKFYQHHDPHRDSGFTIFYMGINIGIISAALSAGFIQRAFGWNIAYATAALGMLLAIIIYTYGFRYFEQRGAPKQTHWHTKLMLLLFILTAIIATYFLISRAAPGRILLDILGALLLIALLVITARQPKPSRDKMLALVVLILISVIFWAIYFQMYFSITLFVKRCVDRHLFGIELPTITFLSLEAIFNIIIGIPLVFLWRKLNQTKRNLSAAQKFGLALLAVGVAMFFPVIGTHYPLSTGYIAAWWLFITYFLISVGEMLLSPTGLSLVGKLAPPKLTGVMMGVWFMALGYGGLMTGYLSELSDIPTGTNLQTATHIYAHAFTINAWIGVISGVLTLLLSPLITRLAKQQSVNSG